MSSPTKKKFVLRIPLRKLREAKEKKNNLNSNETLPANRDMNDTDSASNTTIPSPISPLSTRSIDQHSLSNSNDANDSNDSNDSEEDMHDFHGIPSLTTMVAHPSDIPGLSKQLSNNDIYTDDEDELENGHNGRRKLKLKSAFLLDNEDLMNLSDSDAEAAAATEPPQPSAHPPTDDAEDAEDDDEQTAHDIEMQTHNEEMERLRKQKENDLRMVDREYESIMKEMRSVNHKPSSNQILKMERQKEIERIDIDDENHWIQNEKHAICMRHISIRDDKRQLLQQFMKQSMDINQFGFIKMNLETYFKLKQHRIDDHLFVNMDRLQLTQLFNCQMNSELQHKMTALVHDLEQYLMEKHFEIRKAEKSVTFRMELYERDCASVKNKLESCPVLYILLMKHEIEFDALLSADMIAICLMCMNAVLRKKVQRKLEALVKKGNARSVERLLFKHWEAQRNAFMSELNQPQTETKTNTESEDASEKKTNGERPSKTEDDDDDEVQVIEDTSKQLHDKYPLFCQRYLRFLMSFPNYRNLIISNPNEMHKIFEFTKAQLIHPPELQSKKKTLANTAPNIKKRKHFGAVTDAPYAKRRKVAPSSSEMNHTNTHKHHHHHHSNNHAKERVIWDGTLINDTVTCRVKMKQIGGKSVWTLPFKSRRPTATHQQQMQELSISGRINILSIIKFIKQLRKHKTRRIIFAEIESNGYAHDNSYNALCGALRNSNRAGVIDFEKQCGILIYIISSGCLSPAHAMSPHLNKYFDGHKAKTPKTKIFSIIILSLEVYNQVKRKTSKEVMYLGTTRHNNNNNNTHNGNGNKAHIMASSNKPAQPPKPQLTSNNTNNAAPPPPMQPPKPPPNIKGTMAGIPRDDSRQQTVDDVWDKIGNEIAIEDDLGELPPPLPAHLLAERERYKQQTKPPPVIAPPLPPTDRNNQPPIPAPPPPLPMPHNQTVVYGHGQPVAVPVQTQQIMYPQIQVQVQPPRPAPPQPPPVPIQMYPVQYPHHPHHPPHYG